MFDCNAGLQGSTLKSQSAGKWHFAHAVTAFNMSCIVGFNRQWGDTVVEREIVYGW